MQEIPFAKILAWFLQHQRDLPWRNRRTPYRVWISEVMLQQTQTQVVIPYFERWMERFPTIHILAQASLEQVLKAWEGLGYYSRARNLHQAAQIICQHYHGHIPSDLQTLQTLPGFGPYTAAAVYSFAFHGRAAAVDSNVLRLLARLWGIEEPIDQVSVQKRLRQLLDQHLPAQQPWIGMEALIELGAMVCRPRPHCSRCPLNQECRAAATDQQARLPLKSSRPKSKQLIRQVAVICYQNLLLVGKVPKKQIMQDLYEFPYIAATSSSPDLVALHKQLCDAWQLPLSWQQLLPAVRHSYTRFQVTLLPSLWSASATPPLPGYAWMAVKQVEELPFSAGHRRIFEQLRTLDNPSTSS